MERFDLLVKNFQTLNNELKVVQGQLKKENKDIFNAIVENSPNFISIIQDGKFVFVNSNGLRLLQCNSSTEIIGKKLSSVISYEYQKVVNERLVNIEQELNYSIQIKIKRLDNTTFYSECNFVPFTYNKKPAVLIIGNEATAKLEQQLILENEKKLRTDILNSFKEIIAFYTPGHEIVWLNEAGKNQLNIKDGSYIGELCYKVWFNSNAPCKTCPVVHNKNKTTERIISYNDSKIWKIRHIPIFNKKKDVSGYIEFRMDITEAETMKIELEKSYARQVKAEIAKSFGHIEKNLRTGHCIWSQGIYNILGLPYSKNCTKEKDIIDYVHPDDVSQVKHFLDLIDSNSKKIDLIFRITDAGGHVKNIRGIAEIIRDPITTNEFYFAVIQDITHITDLKKQIIDEKEKYKLLAENAPFGLILLQNSRTVYINRTFMDLFGINSITDFEELNFLSFFHPNDKLRAKRLLKNIRNNDIPSPIVEKLRIINKSGHVQYIRFDLNNNIINGQKYIQSVVMDITDDVVREKKQKQVAADALYINQKNSILSEIEEVLKKILLDSKLLKFKGDFKRIFDIIDSYKQLDKDWKMLIANFEEVHPGFFKKLTKTYPLLSPNDIKHCACIKMNFDTKEIARFFNIKVTSVQASRVRLKKKMDLHDSVDLRSFILNF